MFEGLYNKLFFNCNLSKILINMRSAMTNFKKIIPVLIGANYLCFGCGNRTSSSSNNRSDIKESVTFSAKLNKEINGDSKIDDNYLNITGKY
jgi:hypothetical protein